MNKTGKKALILLLAFALALSQGISAFAWEEGQKVDIDSLSASDWMDAVPDGAYISALNIPGTHDSGLSRARFGFGRFAQCQELTIAEQLEAGVRIFDIRLRFGGDPDDFYNEGAVRVNYICHGQGATCCDGYKPNGDKYTYADVLDEMAAFLEQHESEAIFFFVRNEDFDKDDTDEDDCYRVVLEENEDAISARFAAEGKEGDFVRLSSSDVPAGTMGDYRGKLVRFPEGTGLGDLMDEEKYDDSETSYADKWANIKPYFDSAEEQTLYVAKLKKISEFRCAYTSCTGRFTYDEEGKRIDNNIGIIDQFPTGKEEAEEMNKLLMRYPFKRGAYYGWIGMDMVTEDLARLIFQTNDFNETGMIRPPKITTYMKDIAGFCDTSYDDAVERCYAAGYTPIPAKVSSSGRITYNINPEGYPIVLGYTTTTNPDGAITDIVGRFDSNVPGGYEKVLVYNSMYNYFTRGTGWGTEDTYLFVARSGRMGRPITELIVLFSDPGTVANMVSMDKDGDIPVGSDTVFNLQAGVEDDNDREIFVGLQMVREGSVNKYGTFLGSGNLVIVLAGAVILVLAALLLLEKKKNKKLEEQLDSLREA